MKTFLLGKLPASGPNRTAYLAEPDHWEASRRRLHDELLASAMSEAMQLAESIETLGRAPTLIATRGNTAAGKSHLLKHRIPQASAGIRAGGGAGCLNPDAFKSSLAHAAGHPAFSHAEVHRESLMLGSRLEGMARQMTTRSGALATIVVDRRLHSTDWVDTYAAIAGQTGRKFELWDVDAPIQQSILGVLERPPEGDEARPAFDIIKSGFLAVRLNRQHAIDKFVSDPELGSYHLFGSLDDHSKTEVASVSNGKLTIHERDIFADMSHTDEAAADALGEQIIDTDFIDRLISGIPDPDRAERARAAMESHRGETCVQALNKHSLLIGQAMET